MKEIPFYITTAKKVYEELVNLILNKDLKAGQRLPEKVIAEKMGVSRTPVREALKRLANEGIVEIVPGGGTRLISPSADEIKEAFEVRSFLETMAIKKAVIRIAPVQICLLEEQIQAEKTSFIEKDTAKYLEANNAFHSILAQASGNALLEEYVKNVLARTYVYMVFYESFFSFQDNPSLEEHKAIIAALKMANEDQAVSLIQNHITNSIESLIP